MTLEFISKATEDYFKDWDRFSFEVHFDAKQYIAKRIIERELFYQREIISLAKHRGESIEEVKKYFQRKIEEIVNNMHPFIAITSEKGYEKPPFKRMLDDRRFKSIFESKNTREGWNTSNLSNYLLKRAMLENKLLGFPIDPYSNSHLRPIYGYSTNNDNGIILNSFSPFSFGSVICKIKNELKCNTALIVNIEDGTEGIVPFKKPHFTLLIEALKLPLIENELINNEAINDLIDGKINGMPKDRKAPFRLMFLSGVSSFDIEEFIVVKADKCFPETYPKHLCFRYVPVSLNRKIKNIENTIYDYSNISGHVIPFTILDPVSVWPNEFNI